MQGLADKEGAAESLGALALQVREQPTQLLPELSGQFAPVQPDLTRKQASLYLLQRWQLRYEPGSLARLGTAGRGPAYHMRGKMAFYAQADLDAWAQAKITAPRRKTARMPGEQAA
jgi:hypothetical protein